jgi:hypothetical protein
MSLRGIKIKAGFTTTLVAALASVLALQSCGKPESADFNFDDVNGIGRNNPYPRFRGGDVAGEKNFAALINKYAEGKPKRAPWAGYWWPYKEQGIASARSGSGGSPAGKYDAARGNQTSAQSWESRFHGPNVKGIQGWWGHCNGWCASAALYPEPNDSVKVNGIEFGIADIKGLLAEAGMSANADFFGNRVDFANDFNTPKADDTVPDQYFLVLTNYMGKLGNTVLIDRFTGEQVWNQPLAGYRMEYPKREDYLGADPANPNVYRINVTSTMWWASDEVAANVQTPPFDFPAYDTDIYASRVLKMEIWLDGPVVFGADGKITSSGNVIVTRQGEYFLGGAWKMGGFSNDAWPDYMWVPYSLVPPTDPDDDSANPQIDIRWIENHILVPGGRDDTSAHPGTVQPAPSASPRPSSTSTPNPGTTSGPIITNPTPVPTSSHSPWWPFPWPTSNPTSTPAPAPVPTHSGGGTGTGGGHSNTGNTGGGHH